MELTETLKRIFIETAKTLKGSAQRLFKVRVVKALGKGGQRRAEAELGWDRGAVRKGSRELESGFQCYDNFAARGRKRAEQHLPNLLDDIKAIADAESQTDPSFKTTRLYIRISAAAVRKQLIEQKNYEVGPNTGGAIADDIRNGPPLPVAVSTGIHESVRFLPAGGL